MPHTNQLFPMYNAHAPLAEASATHRTTFVEYKRSTEITDKRRDTATKKIDKLIEDHLTFPNNPHALQRLYAEAPKHLERLQRSSPMRHALITSQLNQIVHQASAYGASGHSASHHAQVARDYNHQPTPHRGTTRGLGGGSGHRNNVVIDGGGSGSGGRGGGSGQGGLGSGGS